MKSKHHGQSPSVAVEHLEFLITFIRDEYDDLVSEISSSLHHGEITFELLWAIMLHRTPLCTKCTVTGEPLILWANGIRNVEIDGRPACLVNASGIDYNSQFHCEVSNATNKFGISEFNVPVIWEFKGAVKINQLAAFPLEYHSNLPELGERLLRRGKKWANLQGVHHKLYTGNAYYRTPKGCIARYYVNSRIMIDWKALEEIEPNFGLPQTSGYLEEEQDHALCNATLPDGQDVANHFDTPFVYTSSIVYGFSLTDKRWLMFDVNHVKDFKWSDEPINNLVLPSETKELIKALVEKHSARAAAFDDFVQGKGQGLVVNLFGKPGVGKTLTVEAISEHVKKPLYVVGAGDLGTTARELDHELSRIFKAATKWNAVVLIDEADVFLEQRSLHDLQRNAVVAVFLRQLEYYCGILFMTTNRVRSFDEAFQSRIHLSLHFHDLDSDAKRQIWLAFINKSHRSSGFQTLPNAGLSDAELERLVEKQINGRQIKNVVGTAGALAEKNNEVLRYQHLIGVLNVSDRFALTCDALSE